MEQENSIPNSIAADLNPSWHIPRPTLARNSNTQGSTSSNNSTQSIKSGLLLLTAANLAQIHKQETKSSNNINNNLQYFLNNNNEVLSIPTRNAKKQEDDNASVASSTHFTVINVNTRAQTNTSCCRKHQLTLLVVSMSVFITLGIMAAIWCLELRARRQLQ